LNSACDKYVAELDETLSRDDFDAAATLLAHCKEMLLHLEDWCLFAANKGKVKAGVHRRVRSHTKANAERALEAICDKRFDSALGALLDVIRRSSEHETLLILISETVCQPVGAADYQEVSEQLDGVLVSLAEGLQAKLTGECVMVVAQRAFLNVADATGSALQHIDDAHATPAPVKHETRAGNSSPRLRTASTTASGWPFKRTTGSRQPFCLPASGMQKSWARQRSNTTLRCGSMMCKLRRAQRSGISRNASPATWRARTTRTSCRKRGCWAA
jgi:hypothetical protein